MIWDVPLIVAIISALFAGVGLILNWLALRENNQTRQLQLLNDLNSKPILYHYTFKSFLSTAFKISSCLLVNFTNFVTSNPFTESFFLNFYFFFFFFFILLFF